ncbi:MAG: FAD:protein FMN transferase [Nitrosomonadales bacterium]|nr:FAD:protein FMN transferase [Nitrosomonadales bacterium]
MAGLIRFLAVIAVLSLAACSKEPPLYQEQGYVFGTLVDVTVYGESEPRARQAVNEVLQEFQRLHNLLHAWQPSELSELNAAFARGESKAVSPELAAMLQDAAQLSQQSQGLFNPAIGGLVQLWGFHADEFKAALPDEKQIAALVQANPQMGDLVFSSTPNPSRPPLVRGGEADPPLTRGVRGVTVSSNNKVVRLDLGGYAKGYALDRAAEILRKQGIRNALINIGGNVFALGRHGKRPWRVGIQHPRKPGALATLELRDGEAIGTSGDYQRYFMLGGTRYCHLIDPRSGHPAQGVQAATVLIKPLAIRLDEQTTLAKSLVMTRGTRAGVLSDATSKPLFIAGAGGWRAAALQMNLPEAMLVDGMGNIHLTAELQKRLEFTDKGIHPQVE